MRDRVQMLQNALLLEEVPEAELVELSRLARNVDLAEAETFAVRGQPSPGMVMVEAGNLEVLLDSSPICSLSPGSLFSEDALVSENPAPATLRAATRSQVSVVERKRMVRELARLPALNRALEVAYRRRVLAARLYAIDLFQGLGNEVRALLTDRFDVVDVPGGSLLAEQGRIGDAFYVIREGEALLHLEVLPGEAPQTATLRTGDYLGDAALVEDKPHTATVSAPSDVRVMKLDRKGFHAALAAHPEALDEVKAAFARRSESLL